MSASIAAPVEEGRVDGRPTARLSMRSLLQISVYWLAINALWGAVDIQILPFRMDQLVCGGLVGSACLGNERPVIGSVVLSKEAALAVIALTAALVAMAVQPIVAAISDYTITRWGRRKPYIFVGTVLDVAFLAGLAWSDTFLATLAFILLLQFSSNFAQGPFQGYVPDLVPAQQVGLASGLMGLMIILGNFAGLSAAGIAIAFGWWQLGLVVVAVLELSTMLATVLTVREPVPRVPPRRAASVRDAVRATLREIRSHRDFLWLLGSRFTFLVGASIVTRWAFFYMQDSIGLDIDQAALAVVIAGGLVLVFNGLSVFPSGLLSDRLGRKPLIYLGCTIALVGMLPLVVAQREPALELALGIGGQTVDVVYPLAGLAIILVGIGFGVFIAVDWALMTDIVPKATTGRYMGISNVATAIASPVALVIGGIVISLFNGPLRELFAFGTGPRATYLIGAALFVASALLVRPLDPRRREGIRPVEEATA
jgi:MFS family permease